MPTMSYLIMLIYLALDKVVMHHKATILNILTTPVLHNLIQNSIESGSSVKIFLQAEQKEGTLTLMVRDDGPGISAKQQKNLFKPVISQKENGSGIGLAISKELATRAGASLRLIESNNKGTCFSINIPTSTNHC